MIAAKQFSNFANRRNALINRKSTSSLNKRDFTHNEFCITRIDVTKACYGLGLKIDACFMATHNVVGIFYNAPTFIKRTNFVHFRSELQLMRCN